MIRRSLGTVREFRARTLRGSVVSALIEEYLVINESLEKATSCSLPRGTATVFSRRSPNKDGPNEDGLNEDAAAVLAVSKGASVLAVADGLGGLHAGAKASETAIKELVRSIREADATDGLREPVLKAFDRANDAILKSGQRSGTTLSVALVEDGAVRFFHVGDSMILLMGQRGAAHYQTMMHSPVGYAVESGLIDEDDAMYHESRHLISNILGSEDMAVEMGPSIRLHAYDTLLLGSDGLFDNLHVNEIIERSRKGPLAKVVKRLSEDTLERMTQPKSGRPSKSDDLTIVAYRFGRKS